MRDHQGGAPNDQFGKRVLDRRFRFWIGERFRLIEHQDWSVGEYGPGDRYSLCFPAREQGILSSDGVVAARQLEDSLVNLCGTSSLCDVFI